MSAVLALLFAGFLAGVYVCAVIWWAGEVAERQVRIERARRRDHSQVPDIRAAVEALS